MKSAAYIGCQLPLHADQVPEEGYPWIVEPKMDGFRLLAHIDANGVVELMARGGATTPYDKTCRHIAEALEAKGLHACWVDGELQAENWNETAKLVRLKDPTEEELTEIRSRVRYYVFDYVVECSVSEKMFPRARVPRKVGTESFARRREILEDTFWPGNDVIRLVPQHQATNQAEAQALLRRMLEMGREGAVFKQPFVEYVFDRHESWVAVKPVETVDGKVVGFAEGTGKHEGRLGALLCNMLDGTVFAVGTGFSDAERQEIWDDQDEFLGRWAEVKCQGGQKVATIRHPAFMRWRVEKAEQLGLPFLPPSQR